MLIWNWIHVMIKRIFVIMKIWENRCRPQNRLLRAMWTAALIELMKSHVFDMFDILMLP